MYHYLEDKEFTHKMRSLSGEIMQSLCHYLKEDYDIGTSFHLVGSGAKNLILQNANNAVDLDYNLEIVRCKDYDDCRYLKECCRKTFNKVLREYKICDCEDSRAALTSKPIQYESGNKTKFAIDVAIIKRDKEGHYHRLIHEKTGWDINDRYFWNIALDSKRVKQKADHIKKNGKWALVRDQYLKIKNRYLSENDFNHPSFVCYVEAVNNVYNSRKHW